MKKVIALVLALCVLLSLSTNTVFAAQGYYDSGDMDSGRIEINAVSGNDVELRGEILPSIISVTMPSYIPFQISRSLSTENKVVSPRIDIINHSATQVSVYVDNTRIDLSELEGTTWSTYRYLYGNQIAIGMAQGSTPSDTLDNITWLLDGKQKTNLMSVWPYQTGNLHLAGTLGYSVPENRSFSVVATLVAKQTQQ